MAGYPVSSGFWAASSSWYRTHLAAQAKGARTGVEPLARREALWKSRGKHYLRGYQKLSHSLIRVDPAISRDVLEMLDAMAPALQSAYDRYLGGLAFGAWREWPVLTGLSKSLLSLEYEVRGDRFVGSLKSRAPYTFFIKALSLGQKQPHLVLIDRPSRAVAEKIAESGLAAVAAKGGTA